MRIVPVITALASVAAAHALPAAVAAEAPGPAKPGVEAPAPPRDVPARPELLRPDGNAPRAMDDEDGAPDWRGCPYFERKLERIV